MEPADEQGPSTARPEMNAPSADSSLAIADLLQHAYGLQGRCTRLSGENENYRVDPASGPPFVLKLLAENARMEEVELEDIVVQAARASGIDCAFPGIVRTQQGELIASSRSGNQPLRARLLEFVDGQSWRDCEAPEDERLEALGQMLGKLDLALQAIEAPAARRTGVWDLARAEQHRDKITLIQEVSKRRMLEAIFHRHAAQVKPFIHELRWSIIHADANNENLLVSEDRLTGLVDFGDVLLNPTIAELAIALAYAMVREKEPLQIASTIVAAYHAELPLSELELRLLMPLVETRLATTVLVAEERRRQDPEHPNWFASEQDAWDLIEALDTIDPREQRVQVARPIHSGDAFTRGPSASELHERRDRSVGSSLSVAYDDPLKIVLGRAQYLFDDRERPFLDLVNNVCHVGHCHPHVVEAGQKQMATLNTNTRYLYDGLTDYAERLLGTLCKPLEVCYFVNSGSEANELALRLARAHTGREDILVVDGAYHGNTSLLIEISPYKFMGPGGSGTCSPRVHIVPMPDGYRGQHKGSNRAVGEAYGHEVEKVIDAMAAPPAAFISESIFGCGGQVIPPEGYLETAYAHVRAAGGVCIADEVQVGFGRVGTHYWAFERQNVQPDIVVMGKPIGNGHPMAAVVTTRPIAESFADGMEFFATFGGNPVSCAIGQAVLDVIEGENLPRRAERLGARFLQGLLSLQEKHMLIGDVRGAGLFIGVELVRDRETLAPAAEEATALVEAMKQRGVLLSTDGPLHNVIKIKPPMVLDANDIDMVLRMLDDELTALTN
ncbi:MAG: 4-aminobutyrate aminotransferase-like enzyme/Ser/Thr protein kinase RdoA (MazF antagonist) [Planctomycetota bacterium]|jgi:4-aminobutyrate aminotransferase-like enzyme/Ser/Thr protein kinase RdoA (MazF antagonist)